MNSCLAGFLLCQAVGGTCAFCLKNVGRDRRRPKPCVCTAKSGLKQADGNGLLPDPPMQQDCYCPASVHELLEACCGYCALFLLQHLGKAGVWQSRNRIIAGGWQALGLGLLKPRVRREQAVCSVGARKTSSVCSWTLQPRCAFPDFAAVLLGHRDALLARLAEGSLTDRGYFPR